MATVRKEIRIARSADEVWAVLKRFDKVHEMAKGFVTATKMEGEAVRVVTFANGIEMREHLVTSDDAAMRLVYAIKGSPRFTHYSAAAQILADGDGSRFVWTVDFLPDDMAPMQDAAMSAGAEAMRKALS
jgi:carbon monoxide dehydrogenase subunit G